MATTYASLTPYNYSFNDPVSFVDVNGANPWDNGPYAGNSAYYYAMQGPDGMRPGQEALMDPFGSRWSPARVGGYGVNGEGVLTDASYSGRGYTLQLAQQYLKEYGDREQNIGITIAIDLAFFQDDADTRLTIINGVLVGGFVNPAFKPSFTVFIGTRIGSLESQLSEHLDQYHLGTLVGLKHSLTFHLSTETSHALKSMYQRLVMMDRMASLYGCLSGTVFWRSSR